MPSEGATTEIAVDIVSIESAAAEGGVQNSVLDRTKLSSTVPNSDTHGQDGMLDREGEITAVPETNELNSEHQSSAAGHKKDGVDAERQTTDSEVGNALDSEHPTHPSLGETVPSWDPPPELESCYITEYSSRLFRAALSDDWGAMMLIAEEAPAWLRTRITKGGSTVVHVAAAAKRLQVVKALTASDPSSLLHTNKDGNTPFCPAVTSGVVEIAKTMQEQNNELPNIRNRHGMTPLHMAVLEGHRAMVWYLLEVTDIKRLTNQDRMDILTSSIDANLIDVALHMLENNLHLALLRDARGETALHVLARKPLKEVGHRTGIWRIFSGKDTGDGEESIEALELTRILWNQVIQQKMEDITTSICQPWPLVSVAAQLGKVEFLTLLIQSYPYLIWKVDGNGYNIFQLAIINRQAEIFKLIYAIGANKDLIEIHDDVNGNHMLHLASKLAPLDRLTCVSGAALQMQRELQWFEAVKQIVRSEYTKPEKKNKKTPQALFSEEHEPLRKQGEEWMKKTAESCALVAALIATMVFTSAFQVPGGFNSDTGSPVLVKTTSFVFFAMANAVSLFTSTASLLMFLSILTSRYAERNFLKALPEKLIIGLALLLISIVTMVFSFTVTFFITFQEGSRWPPITVAILALVPITLFGLQQFPLLAEMYYSTYQFKNTLYENKRKLFHVSTSKTSTLEWRHPNTAFHQIKQRHVEHRLESYLPRKRRLTRSDISTITHKV